MKIRKGRKSDFQKLWKILTKAPELQSDPKGETYDKYWLNDVLNSTRDNLVLIVEDKDKFVGFAIVHYLKGVKQSIINDIFVIEEYRKKGVASKLIEECEKDAKKQGFEYVTGLVRTNNKKMQKLQEKLGYKKGNKFYFYEKVIA